jgi:hypothetical protein
MILMRPLTIAVLAGLIGCASTPRGPAEKIERREARAVVKEGPSALPEEPTSNELPLLIDDSLEVTLDTGRSGRMVRVGFNFAIHGTFRPGDLVVAQILRGNRGVSKAVKCPQRATQRTGSRVLCRADADARAGEIPTRDGTYNFTLKLRRDGRTNLLRRGRFSVFRCSYGLCLDEDGRLTEHWADFENGRLTLRTTIKTRPALPALHRNAKRQAKAKAGWSLRTVTSACSRRRKTIGEVGESFEVTDDDGVWMDLAIRTDVRIRDLKKLGKGKLRCTVNINAKHRITFVMRLDSRGRIVPHVLQSKGKRPLLSKRLWVEAVRSRSLARSARVQLRKAKRLRLFGRP